MITQGFTNHMIGHMNLTSGTRAALALNAAYVHLTSGPAIAVRFCAQSADPINKLYVFMDTHTGTIDSITLQASIYNENATLASRPGSTLRDTSTATTMPASNDMWIEITFGTPYTPTVGEILWIVIYNTSASPTVDFPSILNSTNLLINTPSTATGFITSAGFSSNGTLANKMAFVVQQGSFYFGQPFTQSNTSYYANNTLERGIVITPTDDVNVCGAIPGTAVAAYNALVLRVDVTAPGGASIVTWDLDSDANQVTGDLIAGKFFSTVTLTGGQTYKITLTFTSNTTSPIVSQIEDYASYSTMFDVLRAEDVINWPWGAIDDGAGGWTIDKSICPGIALIIQDQVVETHTFAIIG